MRRGLACPLLAITDMTTSLSETTTTVVDLDLPVPFEIEASRFDELEDLDLEEGSYKARRTALAAALAELGYPVCRADIDIELVKAVVVAMQTGEAVSLPESVRAAILVNLEAAAAKLKLRESEPERGYTPSGSMLTPRLEVEVSENKHEVDDEEDEEDVDPEVEEQAGRLLSMMTTYRGLPSINAERPPTQVAKQVAGAHHKLHNEIDRLLESPGLSRDTRRLLESESRSLTKRAKRIVRSGRRDFDFSNCQSAFTSLEEQLALALKYAAAYRADPREEMSLDATINLSLADSSLT